MTGRALDRPRAPWVAAAWRRALVFGMGASGRAASELLLARGVSVLAVDRRPPSELDLGDLAGRSGFEFVPGGEPAAPPAGVDGVVVSPGVPLGKPLFAAARRRGVPVVAEVELAHGLLAGPLVAITGSNGKSTTTALAGAMLRATGAPVEVCGNIGDPLSARVEGPPGRTFVVELSSFQLEAVDAFRPDAAALLNLAPDHLDRYPGMAEYGAAKRAIFRNQEASDVAVLNADDPEVAAVVPRARRRLFSRRGPVADGCYLSDGGVVEATEGRPPRDLFAASQVPLAGVHNLENAMAAALLALALGAEPVHLEAALAGFRGLPHRMERVAEAGGVVWYDDSKGTNPAATAKSLEGFADGSVHLILGGRNKGADPADLAEVVARKARRLYLIGEAAEEFERSLAPHARSERSGTLAAAVAAAARSAKSGEVVVLSPACASFDQFQNFADRGERFQLLVRETLAQRTGGAGGQEAGV
jgi:UDP-N-acetylmuramoylalanine--D-glutamate ligase